MLVCRNYVVLERELSCCLAIGFIFFFKSKCEKKKNNQRKGKKHLHIQNINSTILVNSMQMVLKEHQVTWNRTL